MNRTKSFFIAHPSQLKAIFGSVLLLATALMLAGCSTFTPNNSARLITPQPSKQIALAPAPKPLLTKETSFGQEAVDEDGIEVSDPYEGVNRAFFGVNRGFDLAFVRPISKVYGAVIPGPIRLMARNGLRHLEAPGDLINYSLQGNGRQAGTTLKRFVINSTLGIGGLFDVAAFMGTDYNPTDFGLTLADWGVGEGNYLVNPLLGPSNVRDTIGRVMDIALTPTSYIGIFTNFNYAGVISNGTNIIDQRERNGELLDNVIFASPDPYVTLRSAFLQRRRALVSGTAEQDDSTLPDIETAGQ